MLCKFSTWYTTSYIIILKSIFRQIFDMKRFVLIELFPNVAAFFGVGFIEPKFEKGELLNFPKLLKS